MLRARRGRPGAAFLQLAVAARAMAGGTCGETWGLAPTPGSARSPREEARRRGARRSARSRSRSRSRAGAPRSAPGSRASLLSAHGLAP